MGGGEQRRGASVRCAGWPEGETLERMQDPPTGAAPHDRLEYGLQCTRHENHVGEHRRRSRRRPCPIRAPHSASLGSTCSIEIVFLRGVAGGASQQCTRSPTGALSAPESVAVRGRRLPILLEWELHARRSYPGPPGLEPTLELRPLANHLAGDLDDAEDVGPPLVTAPQEIDPPGDAQASHPHRRQSPGGMLEMPGQSQGPSLGGGEVGPDGLKAGVGDHRSGFQAQTGERA